MKRRISNTDKLEFIRRHKKLALLCFHAEARFNDEEENILVQFAREELKYSQRTCKIDIFLILKRVFKKYSYHFVEGKPLIEGDSNER